MARGAAFSTSLCIHAATLAAVVILPLLGEDRMPEPQASDVVATVWPEIVARRSRARPPRAGTPAERARACRSTPGRAPRAGIRVDHSSGCGRSRRRLGERRGRGRLRGLDRHGARCGRPGRLERDRGRLDPPGSWRAAAHRRRTHASDQAGARPARVSRDRARGPRSRNGRPRLHDRPVGERRPRPRALRQSAARPGGGRSGAQLALHRDAG